MSEIILKLIYDHNYVLSNNEIDILKDIKNLDLYNNNQITYIHPDTFKYLTQLYRLFLSHRFRDI